MGSVRPRAGRAQCARWLRADAPDHAAAPLPSAVARRVASWERFSNGPSLKVRLMSRYLYGLGPVSYTHLDVYKRQVVTASKEGGASLNILSGLVAGNFSAFWIGIVIIALMAGANLLSQLDLATVINPDYAKSTMMAAVFSFGLVAFGFLGMGPVTIAVDSYGPVTDNAQSVYELSTIEQLPSIEQEIKRDFGFEVDFRSAKYLLEENDGCGNTFKATAKPVLIGTAVVGATTMIFSIIMLPVSYTHLDVYKRQLLLCCRLGSRGTPLLQ